MPYDKRHCTECGEPMVGPFCAHCGTRSAQVTEGAPDATHDEPTRMRADVEPDSPYRGYADSDDYDDRSGDPTQGAGPSSSGPNRTNQMLLALIGLVSVAVVGMLTYLFMHRDARTAADAPAVSGGSNAHGTSRPGTSSTSDSSKGATQGASGDDRSSTDAGGTHDANTSDASGGKDGGDGTASGSGATNDSSSSKPSPDKTDVSDLDGLVTTTSMGGTTYGMTRSGNDVTVWQNGSDGAEKVGTFTLYGGGGNGGLEFFDLPGCSKPVIGWNAAGTTGSAVYGFDGSGYQAYVGSAEGSMSPSGGTGTPPKAFGVNSYDGMLEVRDSPDQSARGKGNHFDRCDSSAPDVLHMVSAD